MDPRAEAQAVMAYRTLGMLGYWQVQTCENERMCAEKAPAFAEAGMAAGQAVMEGKRPDQIAQAWLQPLQRKVSANRRRLAKGGLRRRFTQVKPVGGQTANRCGRRFKLRLPRHIPASVHPEPLPTPGGGGVGSAALRGAGGRPNSVLTDLRPPTCWSEDGAGFFARACRSSGEEE